MGGGGRVAWVKEGHYSTTPHDSTQGQAEQRFIVYQLLLYGTLNTTLHLMDWYDSLYIKLFPSGTIPVELWRAMVLSALSGAS